MITIDTSGLVAALFQRDRNHARVAATLANATPPRLIPTAILAEIAYLLESRKQHGALDAVLEDIESGFYELDCGDENVPRVRQLMRRYEDLPLGLSEACVIACAESHGGHVLTVDRDFWVVSGEGQLTIVP